MTALPPEAFDDPRADLAQLAGLMQGAGRGEVRPVLPCDEPDVLLDVPMLRVEEINLEAERLRAHVAVVAELADLLRLSVGADVDLEKVKLTIKGVEAEALLKARLDEICAILDKVLSAVSENPEILDAEILGEERTLGEICGVASPGNDE